MMTIDDTIQQVLTGIEDAITKHPRYPKDLFHALAVLQEEVGEVTKAALDATYANGSRSDIIKEAVQTAASAIRFLHALTNGHYVTRSNHAKDTISLQLSAVKTNKLKKCQICGGTIAFFSDSIVGGLSSISCIDCEEEFFVDDYFNLPGVADPEVFKLLNQKIYGKNQDQ